MNEVHEWREAPAADFAVIGDPVAHSLSPKMHQAAYQALGLPFRYLAIRVSSGEVSEALDHLANLGFRGINVTVPHKAEAMAWAISCDSRTQRIGAANTLNLTTKEATNTDAPGFLDTLTDLNLGRDAPGPTPGAPSLQVLILGAGGSARALAAALPEAGFQVAIWNRTPDRAEALAKEFGLRFANAPVLDVDLIVNTTSAGLQGDRLPLDWSTARAQTIAYDLVYGETPFLAEAKEKGLRTMDGKPLLVAQGARSFEWWLGIEAPRAVMMNAIR